MSPEQEPKYSLRELKDFYFAGSAEIEVAEKAQVHVPEKGEDTPDNLHRRTQRTYEKDLGPLGKASFLRGEYPGDNNPDAGKWYETWTLPGELGIQELGIGVDTLTKVRTATVHESNAKKGIESSWGDGEFSAAEFGIPDLHSLEPTSSSTDEKSGKVTDVFELGSGKTIFREQTEGRPDHVYGKFTFPNSPELTLDVPSHGGDPNTGARELMKVKLVVDRVEANLDADAQPPIGRVKFRVERIG